MPENNISSELLLFTWYILIIRRETVDLGKRRLRRSYNH